MWKMIIPRHYHVVADNCQKLTKSANEQSQTRSQQYQCTYQIWWKFIDIYSNYCPETKMQMGCGQIALSKIDEICPIAIPNQTFITSMHNPSLVKILWNLLKLLSENENGCTTDG